jgi:hypothetical protein
MAGYHAIRGEFEQCDKLIAKIIDNKWPVRPLVDAGKMLGLIRLERPQEAIQLYNNITTAGKIESYKMKYVLHFFHLILFARSLSFSPSTKFPNLKRIGYWIFSCYTTF